MPIWHILIALTLQAACGLTTGDWLAGGLFAAGIFVGREHAQAEYRWIETYGKRKRANMPWWGGFDPRVWNRKSMLDWLAPLAAVTIVKELI